VALFLTALPLAFFIGFYSPFMSETALRMEYFNDFLKASIISSVIAIIYVLIWWRKIREEK